MYRCVTWGRGLLHWVVMGWQLAGWVQGDIRYAGGILEKRGDEMEEIRLLGRQISGIWTVILGINQDDLLLVTCWASAWTHCASEQGTALAG